MTSSPSLHSCIAHNMHDLPPNFRLPNSTPPPTPLAPPLDNPYHSSPSPSSIAPDEFSDTYDSDNAWEDPSSGTSALYVPLYNDGNVPFGDFTHPKKPDHVRRIYSINIRGLALSSNLNKLKYIAQQAAGNAINILGLIATDTKWTNQTKSWVYSAFQEYSHSVQATFSQLSIQSDQIYQPGGNCIVTTGVSNTFLTSSSSDCYGRWASTTYQPSPDLSFTYITAYYPMRKGSRPGKTTSFRQQYLQMMVEGDPDPKPVNRFYDDLKSYILSLRDQNQEIILAIDANCADDDPGSKIQELRDRTQLVDMILHQHPNTQENPLPKTYLYGSKRINYICCTEKILPAIHRVGYDAFGEIFLSDHRGMCLDLDWRKLTGTHIPQDLFPSRHLSTKHRDHINTYKSTLYQYFQDHNVPDRLTQLQQLLHLNAPRNEIIKLTKALDRDFTRDMLRAARSCKVGFLSPYSTTLANLRKIVGYWNLRLRAFHSPTNLTLQTQDLQDRIQWPDLNPPEAHDLPTVSAYQKNALHELQDYLRSQQSESCLRIFDAFQHTNNNSSISWHQVHATAQHQATQATYKEFRIAQGKQHSGGVSSVSVPSGDSWQRLTDPSAIADAIFQRNIRHFSQAQGTPFTEPHIIDTIKSMTHDPIAAVCNALAQQMGPAAQELLQEFQRYELPLISTVISEDEIKTRFRRWKENTATSPSGRTLTHYKMMLLRDHKDSMGLCKTFWSGIILLLTACLQYGHALEWWTVVHNTMIFKKPGDDRIDKMRVIHIFEADFNLLLGIIWKRVNDNAEQYHALGNSQWGARAGHHCKDVLALKLWADEISKFSRTTQGKLENDARSCYDRIAMQTAMLRSPQLGMPSDFIKMYTDCLHASKFFFTSRVQTDENYYSPSTGHVVHGPGQGSQAATYAWTNVSTCAMQILHQSHPGAEFYSPNGSISCKQVIQGFVDDTAIIANSFRTELSENQTSG